MNEEEKWYDGENIGQFTQKLNDKIDIRLREMPSVTPPESPSDVDIDLSLDAISYALSFKSHSSEEWETYNYVACDSYGMACEELNKCIGQGPKYQPYTIGQVLVSQSSVGSSSLEILQDGIFEIICVAGGGGGGYSYYALGPAMQGSGGGGSGSGFKIEAKLMKGNIYTYTVGTGGTYAESGTGGITGGAGTISKFHDLTTNAGGGGYGDFYGAGNSRGGSGGAATSLTSSTKLKILNIIWNKAGNTGTTAGGRSSAIGGASVYNNYGIGGATDGSTKNGGSGFIQVKFLRYLE